MAITWAIDLKCSECGATIHLENVKPEWKEDEALKAELLAAAAYVTRHQGENPLKIEERRPPFVSFNFLGGQLSVDPVETKFIDCPTGCGGKAFRGSGQA